MVRALRRRGLESHVLRLASWRRCAAGQHEAHRPSQVGARRHRSATRARLSFATRCRKDAAAISRRPAAQLQPHANFEQFGCRFVRNMKMAPLLLILMTLAGFADAFAQATARPPAAPPADTKPARAPMAAADSDYLVGPQDVVNVRIYGEE